MCLSEVLARHAHEHPAQQPAAPSSAYSDSELGDSDHIDDVSDVASSGPATPDATAVRPPRPALSLLITQIRPKYPVRPNERLAVLLPRSLWKPDNMADECDTWTCTTRFSLFERRHHCRKCGGVFCQACTSQKTLLLDTTDLPYFYPPADVSLDEGPLGPMVDSRVCDDCHALIYGRPIPSLAQSTVSDLPPLSNSVSSASSSSVPFPSRPALSRTSSNLSSERARVRRNSSQQPRSSSSSARSVTFNSHPAHRRTIVPEPPAPADLGILSTYPLRQPSAQCKANGGGVWQPRQSRYDSRASRIYNRLDEEDESDNEGVRRPRRTRMIVDGEIKVCNVWDN
ncbi:hypothetical protein FRC10_012085 [Ceratobasidium sp. 414]|nr:hypothetical protein FRC10_012085 [Ceratobasidium sp. 414]